MRCFEEPEMCWHRAKRGNATLHALPRVLHGPARCGYPEHWPSTGLGAPGHTGGCFVGTDSVLFVGNVHKDVFSVKVGPGASIQQRGEQDAPCKVMSCKAQRNAIVVFVHVQICALRMR